MADVETFATTLYLLRAADDLRTLIRRDYLDDGLTRAEDAQVAGHTALLLMRSNFRDEAHWAAPLTQLSGVAIGRQGSISPSAALLIAVDDHVFALTHGHSGRWIVEDDAKEHLFGLRVAIRVLEPAKVRQLTRLALDVSARVDRSVVPAGQEVRGFGVEQYAQIVNQIGGRTTELDLTHSRRTGVPLRLEGADALRIRLGTEPASCIADLRTLAATLTLEPVAELAFIERIRRLRPDRVRRLTRLQRRLGQLLQPGADGPIGLAVPIDHIDDEEAGLTSVFH